MSFTEADLIERVARTLHMHRDCAYDAFVDAGGHVEYGLYECGARVDLHSDISPQAQHDAGLMVSLLRVIEAEIDHEEPLLVTSPLTEQQKKLLDAILGPMAVAVAEPKEKTRGRRWLR